MSGQVVIQRSEPQPGPLRIFKMENFATIVNDEKPFNIVAKLTMLDASGCPGYASDNHRENDREVHFQ